ncbi:MULTISPECIES: LysR family transcriptional regulator [Massilia]|uniref:LysR family transcriptional regulator n=2 Tax=Massilia TaxID=149698 RepID=A0ABX0LRZ1_9BURK|nr:MULTISPECIES: LysR family transcriptional regulator [Massilia]NHZ34219.1 LysR family transcriptional regulator [Massilia rubra]NHZ65931.1 LysR family transcriptional regulator [Massilia genomosp. 1]NHZ95176.1 LysR family transcriptional regulator [Massilia sp. CCM 8734]
MYHASFRQLQSLVLVARHESVSKAAEAMHVTQPAVSLQLRTLENITGVALTRKDGRGIQLTAAGEVMADFAERILRLWEHAGDELAALHGVTSGTLRIGAVTTAEHLLPPLLVPFTLERPDVRLKLQVGNRVEIVNMLARQEIDVAIMGTPPRELRTNAARFARHPMGFVASAAHPLMKKRKLTLADVVGANLLVRERGSGTRTAVERLFKEGGHALNFGSEVSSNEAIKRMVSAGLGVGFLSVHACALEFKSGLLRMLPLKGNPVDADWQVMHLAGQPIPKVAAAFQDYVIEHGQALVSSELEGFYQRSAG